MKILLINKYHYLKGGAERSYFATAKILAGHGHDIVFFSMKHPNNRPSRWSKYFIDQVDYQNKISLIRKIKAVINIFYNRQANRNLEKLIFEFKPDIAHLHNIYHQLSPSIINALKKHKIPIVMTLHDYKLICPNYNLFARGKIWEKSKPGKYYKVFIDKAVKNSYLKSLVCALEAYLHKFLGFYDKIDLFISPSQFLINKFTEYGFKNKIVLLPNALFNNSINEIKPSEEKYILYFGRLSREKGIDVLLNSYSLLNTDYLLKIAGRGEELKNLKKLIEDKNLSKKVILVGHKQGEELLFLIKNAAFIVSPSNWYENCPYGVIEAMSLGKIVVASNLGGLKEIIQPGFNGFLYEAGEVDGLTKIMSYLLAHPELDDKIGGNAVRSVNLKNNPSNFYNKLIEIYGQAIRKNEN